MGVADVEDYPRTAASLESRFSQEGDCLDYLFALRWPDGFCCPNCTNGRDWKSSRGLWLCSGCRRQVSVLAGTVFPRHTSADENVVSSDVVYHKSEKWDERFGAAKSSRPWQLPDGLVNVAQTSAGHGQARAGEIVWPG